MARLLGEAYIAILPDTDRFLPDLKAQVDKDAAAVRGDVNVGAHLNKADVAKIATQLKAISKANPINVGVKLDKAAAGRMAAELAAYMKNQTVEVVTKLDMISLGKMATTLKAFLTDRDLEVGVQLNPAQLAKVATSYEAFVKELSNDDITPQVNVLPALAKMMELKAANASLQKFIQQMNAEKLDLNILPALTKIAELKAAEAALWKEGGGTLSIGGSSNFGALARSVTQFVGAAEAADKSVIPLAAHLANLDYDMKASADSSRGLGDAMAALAAGGATKLANSMRMITLGSGQFGAWSTYAGAHVALFGHALDSVLPSFLRSVSVWHIGADTILELAAAWIPATIAMGVFAAAAAPTAEAIYGQWKNINTVIDSVGGQGLPDVGKGFDKLAAAVKPSVMTAFGEGLMLVKTNAGPLAGALQSVGTVIDNWGASLVQWSAKGVKSFANLVQVGSKDLAGIGDAFIQIGRIIGTIIKDLPGYVHILLALGDGFLTVAADALQFISPLLKVGLAVHGAVLYIGLATTALIALGRSLTAGFLAGFAGTLGRTAEEVDGVGVAAEGSSGKLKGLWTALGNGVGAIAGAAGSTARWAKNLYQAGGAISEVAGGSRVAGIATKLFGDAAAAIPEIPVAGWAVAAAAAIGVGLYLAFRHTEDAIQKFGDALVSVVQNSNPNTLFANTTKAVITAGRAIENLTNQYKALQKATLAVASVGPYTPVKGGGPVGPYGSGTPAGGKGSGPNANPVYATPPLQATQEWVQNLLNVAKAATPAAQNTLAVAKATGSMGNAMQIASALGIKWSDINKATPAQLQAVIIKMQAYQQAISYMSNSQGQAASNVAALNFAASDQVANVQKLNSAWQTFIGTVEGGEAAFVPFEQGILSFAKDAKVAGASMTGLNTQSLTLRSDFQSVFSSAQAQVSALTTYTAATGGATQAQKALAEQGIKAVIAQLIPMAGANKSAQAGIVALAQRANGSLTTWQAVTKWIGPKGAAGAAQTLQRVNGTLASSIQNVVSVANALTGAMQATAVAAQDKLVFALDGGATKMAAFGRALASANGQLTKSVTLTGTQYYNALVKSGIGAETARQMVLSMASSLGVNSAGLNKLNNDLIANQLQLDKQATAAKNAATAAGKMASAFSSLATGALKLTSNQVSALWNNIKQQDLDMVSGKAVNAKAAFINFAENGLKLTQTQAQDLWNTGKVQNLDMLAGKAGTTKDAFVNLAKQGLNLTTQQADALWKELRLQYLDTLVQKGNAAKSSFINLAKQGLDLTTSQATNLWNTLKQQYLDTLASKAGETRQAFEKTASQFGLTKQAADNLWGSLKSLAGGSPYDVAVDEVLSGSGSVSAKISAASIVLNGGGGVITPKAANPKTNPQLGLQADIHKAAGGFASVRGNHSNTDTVPIMVKPNELIIPSEHAPNIAQHMASQGHSLPGFSTGGFVANAASVAQNAVGATNTVISDVKQFAQDVNNQFSSDVQGAYQNAQAAAAGAGSPYGGPSSFGGGFESLSALVSFAKYFMANGLNRAAAAGMAATISGEEDSQGPESRNCVPLTYKIVTPRGILAHDEVQVGDQTMGYNLETGQTELATILDVPYHYDAEMCRIGNSRWSVVCTVDHKWITASRGLVRADRLRMGERVMLDENWTEQVYTFERLDNDDTFCLTTTTGTWTVLTDEGDVIWTGNSSGFGLIGWTGNTVGLPAGYHGPTGNVAYDLKEQLAGVIGYMNARGGAGPLNAAGNPVAAGDVWSTYEAPAVRYSDTRPAVANEIYAALGGGTTAAVKAAVQTQQRVQGKVNQVKPFSAGGTISEPVYGFGANSGTPYSFAENGPEYVSPGSNAGGTNNFMQPMTQSQGMQNNQLLQQLVQLLQQQPYTLAKVVNGGASAGVRSKR